MAVQAPTTTVGRALQESATIDRAIEAILQEVRSATGRIVGVRPPIGELRSAYEDALARLAAIRGRAAHYAYLGSGVGRGALVELEDGSVKWDMIGGIGVHMCGHGDLDLMATALRAALADTVMQGNLQCNADALEFSELLVEEASRRSGLRHCFLTNSGAMANEAALKVCLQKNAPATRILAFNDCFAGRSTTMAAITDNPAFRAGLPIWAPVDYVPFYNAALGSASIEVAAASLKQHLDRYPNQHACFLMELVQGEGGFNTAPREFLVRLMDMCRDRGVAVWADEVQTFGRTEQMFHFDQLDLGKFVDVATIGKLSQACACLYTEAYNPRPGLLSGTFIGSTMALRTGRRILERLRDGHAYGPDGRNATLFREFGARMTRVVKRHAGCFPPVQLPSGGALPPWGGVGGMMRFTPYGGEKKPVLAFLNRLFDQGVIAFYCGHGPYHVRFLPPVGVMEPAQLDEVFAIVEQALPSA
jgi:4-aminobutyrate aminotransferase-like enzyme